MSRAILDDHLLRDLLADDLPTELAAVLAHHEPATTNLHLFRLSRSAVAGRGGSLTGSWTDPQRRALSRALLTLPASVEIVPMRDVAHRMAEVAATHPVSTLGAEMVAASEHLDAPVYVWSGDDGPRVRGAMATLDRDYRTITR